MSYFDRAFVFIQNLKEVLLVANKHTRKEYWMITKIVLVGILLLGALSYVIQLIFTVTLPLGQ